MPLFNFSPEKYWNIQDERISLFKRYLESLNIDHLDLLPIEEIVKICIGGLRQFELTEDEKSQLKHLILAHDEKVLTPLFMKEMRDEISKLAANEITLISLGCGNESYFERKLDEFIAENLPAIKVNWLGLDIGDYRDASSFFTDKPFKVIEEVSNVEYAAFLENKSVPAVLIGRYSFHHIGVEFDEFITRCAGIAKVILIEEPTTTEKWGIPDYRFMRIAYDILANTVFVLDWAEIFIKNPDMFKVNYIKTDALPKGTRCIEINDKDLLPETALVIYTPSTSN